MPTYTNKFEQAHYVEKKILGSDGRLIGAIRIKPSSVLWKPSGQGKYYAVPLDKFTEWIASKKAAATRTTS